MCFILTAKISIFAAASFRQPVFSSSVFADSFVHHPDAIVHLLQVISTLRSTKSFAAAKDSWDKTVILSRVLLETVRYLGVMSKAFGEFGGPNMCI